MKIFRSKKIKINKEDINDAKMSSATFKDLNVQKRAFLNVLGARIVVNTLYEKKVKANNIYSLYTINSIREKIDIADIYYKNLHIDIRVVFDENLIFVPKSHFLYNIEPHLYLVLKMDVQNFENAEILGYFIPNDIDKTQENAEYYFVNPNKIRKIENIKKLFDTVSVKKKTEKPLKNVESSFIELIDNKLSEKDISKLLQTLNADIDLREKVTEFEGFEFIARNTASDDIWKNDGLLGIVGTQDIHNEDEEETLEEVLSQSDEDIEKTSNDIIEEAVKKADEVIENAADLAAGLGVVSEEIVAVDNLSGETEHQENTEPLEIDDSTGENQENIEEISENSDNQEENLDEEDSIVEEENQPQEDDLVEDEEIPQDGEQEGTENYQDIEQDEAQETGTEKIEPEEDDDFEATEEVEIPQNEKLEFVDEDSEKEDDLEDLFSDYSEEESVADEEPVSDSLGALPALPALKPLEESEEDEIPQRKNEISYEYTLQLDNTEDENDESENISKEEVQENKDEPEIPNINAEEEVEDVFENELEDELENGIKSEEVNTDIEKIMQNIPEIAPKPLKKLAPIDLNKVVKKAVGEDKKDASLEYLFTEKEEQANDGLRKASKNTGKVVLAASAVCVLFTSLIALGTWTGIKLAADKTPAPVVPAQKEQIPEEEPEQYVQTRNNTSIEPVRAEISSISWEIPENLAYNDVFREYLQIAGKNLKLNLQNDLLLVTDFVYSDRVIVDLRLSSSGALVSSNIALSSGSKKVDETVLQSVQQTLKYLKVPSEELGNTPAEASLVIYF